MLIQSGCAALHSILLTLLRASYARMGSSTGLGSVCRSQISALLSSPHVQMWLEE